MPAVCSFLKDTRGLVAWSAADLAKALGSSLALANQAIPLLTLQGYVKAAEDGRWMTTIAGEQLSGSVMPRFRRTAVDRALDTLKERIRSLNNSLDADFAISRAVAFGDFLGPAPRVQAADVGILLKRRGEALAPVAERKMENALLTSLRARSQMLRLVRYEDWMSVRRHRKLL